MKGRTFYIVAALSLVLWVLALVIHFRTFTMGIPACVVWAVVVGPWFLRPHTSLSGITRPAPASASIAATTSAPPQAVAPNAELSRNQSPDSMCSTFLYSNCIIDPGILDLSCASFSPKLKPVPNFPLSTICTLPRRPVTYANRAL
jgi:hypothetical protein